MSINLLHKLPHSESTEGSRARRRWCVIFWCILAGIQLLACLSVRWLLTFDLVDSNTASPLSSVQLLLFLCSLAVVFSFPIHFALGLVLPAFTPAVRISGCLLALFGWLSMLWLGHWLTGQSSQPPDLITSVFERNPISTPWPRELEGQNLLFSLPAILLALTAPLLVLQGATGWQLAFPSWEIPERPTWSIRGLMLLTLWAAGAIWMSRVQQHTELIPHSTELNWLFALLGCGTVSLLLPYVSLLLKAKRYLTWFFTLQSLLFIGSLAAWLLLLQPELGWAGSLVAGLAIGLSSTVFVGFSVLPIPISRWGGAWLIDPSESGPNDEVRFQKYP